MLNKEREELQAKRERVAKQVCVVCVCVLVCMYASKLCYTGQLE